MDWKAMLASFAIVFVAELGDKTQLAALALTGRTASPFAVFVGASVALVIVTAIGVGAGALLGKLISERAMEFASADSCWCGRSFSTKPLDLFEPFCILKRLTR